ncbi:alpha-hydroxy acid oxidase [Terricaulis sp.]|uniref:alpha-hydroxy acid oxidase n=1 Tax=Terricaulis sp. TaxID=2768686 RepID=UPI0037835BEC
MSVTISSVEHARQLARRALPPAVFHYIEGGKENERTVRANELAFGRVLFDAHLGEAIKRPETKVTVLGREIAMPVVIAPTGFIRIVHKDAEPGAARAAHAAGIPIAISHLSGAPARDICALNDDTWFQLYMINGRDGVKASIELARAAGCRVLALTIDLSAITPFDRISRALPSKADLANAIAFLPEVWDRPRWLLSLLAGGLTMSCPNAPPAADGRAMAVGDIGKLLTATPPTWDDVAWIRKQWDGPLLIKGIMRTADARRALECGADAISVSNHGGKVIDGVPAAVTVLPEIADAVGDKLDVLLDGGVRRGADVVRACALGAKAVLIGRPYLWGLAAGGEAGVASVLRLFQRGIAATLSAIGCPSIQALDRSFLRPLPDQTVWNDAPLVTRFD